jgi:hypothetical protein
MGCVYDQPRDRRRLHAEGETGFGRGALAFGGAEGGGSLQPRLLRDARRGACGSVRDRRETPTALIKTHHRLIAVFGKELVLGGLIDAGVGREFNKVQDMRQLADYSDEPPPEAQTAVEQAEAFIAAISAMLARLEA